MSFKKVLIGLGVGGGLFAGYSYWKRLRNTSANIQTITHLNIHKLDLGGLILRVDIQIKNPTRTGLKIKFPFIKLAYNGSVIGTSEVVNKDITIPAFGEAVAEKIMLKLSPAGVLSLGAGFITTLQNGKQLKVRSTMISSIDLGWRKFAYEKTEDLILKQ